MTRSSFKLRNVVKNSSQPRRLNLRKVAAIVACLAVTAIFSGCDKDDEKGDYTIKYSPGTHISGDNYSQAKTAGKEVTLRGVTYTRGGFKQTGWSKKANGSSKDYSLNDTYTEDADIELFPFWKDENDPDDDDTKYTLPTNFKYTHETTSHDNFIAETVIKIGENYYYKREFLGTMVYERFMKQNTNGTWTDYYKNNIGTPNWELESDKPLNAAEKTYAIEFIYISSVLWMSGNLSNAVKGGQETIAGVLTDIYTVTHSGGGVTVLYRDPVTKLFFKCIDPSGGTWVVTSWDTSVTSFGITGLP